ncbi:MAG: L,D-transpeptidase family protein [Halanaerobiales bacterium]
MSKYKIYIELKARKLYLKKSSKVENIFPVAVGKPSTPTPNGNFAIINKIINPGGALGTRWMQFTTLNHGIHGTNQPWLIGQAVSLGCVRMYNNDVEILYNKVNVGTPVIIKPIFSNKNHSIYIVQKGDSLWSISLKTGVPISRIKKANNLSSNIIYPGQKIIIPSN